MAVGVHSFNNAWKFYGSGVLQCFNPGSVDHAVVAVGYTSEWHWIVKNSWGTTWGEGGYVNVDRYADCLICQTAGISANVF